MPQPASQAAAAAAPPPGLASVEQRASFDRLSGFGDGVPTGVVPAPRRSLIATAMANGGVGSSQLAG